MGNLLPMQKISTGVYKIAEIILRKVNVHG